MIIAVGMESLGRPVPGFGAHTPQRQSNTMIIDPPPKGDKMHKEKKNLNRRIHRCSAKNSPSRATALVTIIILQLIIHNIRVLIFKFAI